MPTGISEKFANMAFLSVTESAANTITFQELQTGVGIFEKVALIIHRIEYYPYAASLQMLNTAADILDIAITTSDQVTDLLKDKPQVIDHERWLYEQFGTNASGNSRRLPNVADFTGLPGNGLILPSSKVYAAIQGTSLAAAAATHICFYFSYRSVKPEEYWELVEATRALT